MRILQAWRALNRRHNEINAIIEELAGGPDIERHDAPELYDERRALGMAKRALEQIMTDEEIQEIYK